MQNLFLIVHF